MFRCCKLLCYVLGCQFGNFRFICILQNLHWQFSVSSNQWKRLLTVLLLRFVLLLVFSIKRLLSVVDVLSFGIRFHLFYFHISPPSFLSVQNSLQYKRFATVGIKSLTLSLLAACSGVHPPTFSSSLYLCLLPHLPLYLCWSCCWIYFTVRSPTYHPEWVRRANVAPVTENLQNLALTKQSIHTHITFHLPQGITLPGCWIAVPAQISSAY